MRLTIGSMQEFDLVTNPVLDDVKWEFIFAVQELTNTAKPDKKKDADLLFAVARFSIIGELLLL